MSTTQKAKGQRAKMNWTQQKYPEKLCVLLADDHDMDVQRDLITFIYRSFVLLSCATSYHFMRYIQCHAFHSISFPSHYFKVLFPPKIDRIFI